MTTATKSPEIDILKINRLPRLIEEITYAAGIPMYNNGDGMLNDIQNDLFIKVGANEQGKTCYNIWLRHERRNYTPMIEKMERLKTLLTSNEVKLGIDKLKENEELIY